MGRHQGVAADQGDLVRLGRTARADEALRARARQQSRQGRSHRERRQRRRRHGQGRREENQRHLRIRDPHARLDRTLLRDCRIQGRQADILVGVAGDPHSAQAARERCSRCSPRMCAASMSKAPAATAATDTKTPRPTRRCSRKPSACRCACSGRAPTSMAGTRKARRRWSTCAATLDDNGNVDGLGFGVLHPAADAERIRGDAGRGDARRHAADETIAPGQHPPELGIPYKFPNIKPSATGWPTTPFRPSWIRTPGRMQNTFANECFIDELAAAAGADPIEFRLKYLDRTRAGSKCSSGWPRSRSGRNAPHRAGGQSGDVVTRPRRVLLSSMSSCAPMSAGVAEVEVNALDRQGPRTKFYVRARLRADHQSRRRAEPDRRQRRPDGEPDA